MNFLMSTFFVVCRCSAYNRGVNKQGALFLLESIAESLGVPANERNRMNNDPLQRQRVNSNNQECVTCSSSSTIKPTNSNSTSTAKIRHLEKDEILNLSDSEEEPDEIPASPGNNNHDDDYENKNALEDVRRQLVDISPTKQQKQMMLTKLTIRDSGNYFILFRVFSIVDYHCCCL